LSICFVKVHAKFEAKQVAKITLELEAYQAKLLSIAKAKAKGLSKGGRKPKMPKPLSEFVPGVPKSLFYQVYI
jgi:hypothetical protein